MESRKARLGVVKSGGTAGKGGRTFRVTMPTKWIRDMDLGEESRDIELFYDENKKEITVKKAEV